MTTTPSSDAARADYITAGAAGGVAATPGNGNETEADDSDAGMNETDDESGPDAAENDLPAERDLRGHLYDEDNLGV